MNKTTLFAILISVIVIAISASLILALEPDKSKLPSFHDKTAEEVSQFLLGLKENETATEPLFKDLVEVDEDTLKYVFGIEPTYLEDYSVKTSTTDASAFLVLKLKAGSKSLIEQSVIDYMEYLENKWAAIDQEQATLVQGYSKIAIGDYLIYVVSDNNEYIKSVINSLFYYIDEK